MTVEDIVSQKKRLIADRLKSSFKQLLDNGHSLWTAPYRDKALQELLSSLPYAHLAYLLDTDGIQASANVLKDNIETEYSEQDLSQRPYLNGSLPYRGFILSKVYMSQRNQKPVITALQSIQDSDNNLLGFLAVDFNLEDLPVSSINETTRGWSQFRGDPAIRGTLFMQERVNSPMDEQIELATGMVQRLMTEHGIFHGKFHFSSSRVTLWQYDSPYNYRIHLLDELLDHDIFLAYQNRKYPGEAVIKPEMIPDIFENFRSLRQADENIYLRAASLNVINGMIGLTFSCDGSHYIPVYEFLDKEHSFWFGANPEQVA